MYAPESGYSTSYPGCYDELRRLFRHETEYFPEASAFYATGL